jgi:predicted protein tyrosine phosphatase
MKTPPFTIRIEGLTGAAALRQNGWPTRIVSLVDERVMKSSGPHHLVVEVDDIEVPMSQAITPERHHAEAVLDFTKDIQPGEKVLVHCHMGMRRSTASALAVMVQHGMSIEDALTHCYAIRPIMMPNRLMARHYDSVLGHEGRFSKAVDGWINEALRRDDEERRERVERAKNGDHSAAVEEMRRIIAMMSSTNLK